MQAPKSNLKKLAKGAGISFIGQVLSTCLKYISQVSLAWFLGSANFGIYTIGLAIYQISELFARLGLELGVIRYASIYLEKNEKSLLKGVFIKGIILPLINGLIIGIVLFLLAPFLANYIFNEPALIPVIQIFALTIPFGASTTVTAFATTSFQSTTYRTIAWDLMIPLLNFLLIFIFWGSLGLDIQTAVTAWLLANLSSFVTSIYFLSKLFPELYSRRIKPIFQPKKLLTFSLPLSFGSFSWLILIWSDILILSLFRSTSEVGIYRAASQTAFLMILFTRSIVTIFSPMVAKLNTQGEHKQLEQLFNTASRWNFSLTLPIFLTTAILSPEILMLFGSDFKSGWFVLIVLSIGQLTRAGPGSLAVHVLTMTGYQHLKFYADVALATMNLLLNLILIPRFGPLGAAIATCVSMAGFNLLLTTLVNRYLNISIRVLNYLRPLLAAAVASTLAFLVKPYFEQSNFILTIFAIGLLSFVTYFAALFFTGLDRGDRIALKKTAQNLKDSIKKI